MNEVVTRYFTRRLDEEQVASRPRRDRRRQGTAQRGARAALDALGLGAMPIISLAKREEEIFVLGRSRAAATAAPLAGAARAAAGARRGASLRDHVPAQAALDAYGHVGAAAHPRRRRGEASPAAGGASAACRAFATRRPRRSPRCRASAARRRSASSKRCESSLDRLRRRAAADRDRQRHPRSDSQPIT